MVVGTIVLTTRQVEVRVTVSLEARNMPAIVSLYMGIRKITHVKDMEVHSGCHFEDLPHVCEATPNLTIWH